VTKLTLAFSVHDSKKERIIEVVKDYKELLAEFELIATRNTGRMIQQSTGLPVTLLNSGQYGGNQEIGALVVKGKVNAVFLLRDPFAVQAHEPDITALARACDIHNVILSTNIATSEAVLNSFLNKIPSPVKQSAVPKYTGELVEV
jgi:methylglyoxal synthase